jgi:hypothetical protein
MGTRGYLIFKVTGVYYVIYNDGDSYVSWMGVEIANSIKVLCKKFNGNVTLAKEFLKSVLEKIKFMTKKEVEELNFEEKQSYTFILTKANNGFDIEEMSQSDVVVTCYSIIPNGCGPPTSSHILIDYMWEVDVDCGRFGMGLGLSREIFHYWPWKALYLFSSEAFEEEGELRIENWENSMEGNKTPFELEYKATVIQAYVRRFLALKRACSPPQGIFFLREKRKFEEVLQKYV